MLHHRPHNRFEDLENVYLVGGGTRPGSGLPVIFESARITTLFRPQVDERYRDAVELASRDARRFELMHQRLAPVRTENEMMADACVPAKAPQTANFQEELGRGR